jgi:hypothetical protein
MQPTQLGPYRIIRRLGRGGMGAVYEAEEIDTGDRVAVKVLASHLSDDPGIRSRFLAEIETLKSLRNPGIVRLLSFGEQDGVPFFAMELVEGNSLDQLIRSGTRFDWKVTVDTALAVVRALKAAHDQGVIHRDLKPGNLLVTHDGSVKLADFGIAKLFGGDAHTAQGNFVGTADYMAPEQASGKPIDHRVDLYALGMVMFAMLAGRPPFRGRHLTEVVEKQRKEKPPRISSLVDGVPAELDELIDRLLSKKPADRPASALALGRLLAAIRTLRVDEIEPTSTSADTTGGPHPRAGAADKPGEKAAPRIDSSAKTAAPSGSETHGGTRVDADANDATQGFTKEARDTAPSKAPAGAATGRDSDAKDCDGIDLLAVTREVTDEEPSAPVADVDVAGENLAATQRPLREFTQARTDLGGSSTHVDRAATTRFTTIADMERAEAKRASRLARQQGIVSGIIGIVIATLLLGGGWWILQPPGADLLYARIMTVADDEDTDLRDAEPLIREFLDRYPTDPRAEEIRGYERSIEVESLARKARREARRRGGGIDVIERDFRTAMSLEQSSPTACIEALDAVAVLHDLRSDDASDAAEGSRAEASLIARNWQTLIEQERQRLEPLARQERAEDAQRLERLFEEAAELAARAASEESAPEERAADTDRRAALLERRAAILRGIVLLYAQRPHAASAVAQARQLLDEPATAPPPPLGDARAP